MRRNRSRTRAAEQGFTLIELLIAVAIVAILATIAIVTYVKHIKGARIVEAKAFVQLIQARQEAYFQQNGQYCNASQSSGKYPALISGSEPVAKQWNPGANSSWQDLGVRPPGGNTYFQWTVIASDPNASPPHGLDTFAPQMGIPAQPAAPGTPHPWYYILGEADLDGKGTPYTELRSSSARTQAIVVNEHK